MKKKLLVLLAILILTFNLTGCVTTYQNAATDKKDCAYGYFTIIKEWSNCAIVYANDTKVKYFIYDGYQQMGITPLYNEDGSLQIYEGE